MADKQFIDEDLYKDHENRPDLAGEHPLGDTFQLILLLLFLTAIFLDYIFFHTQKLFSGLIPQMVCIPIGLSFIALGFNLAYNAIQIVFSEYRPEPVMITEGLFSKTRHPIYLGAMVVYLGILILTRSLIGGFVFLFVMIMYHFLAKHEEKLMIEIFGEKYCGYIDRVPMWLPKIFKK